MRILISVFLLWLLVPSWSGPPRLDLLGPVARVTATPVPFDAGDPRRIKEGALTWLGGVHLTSPDPAFGGFSSLHVEGDRVTLLSDGGNVVRFRIDPAMRLSAPEFYNLTGGPNTGWGKSDRDSESMTVDPATGQTWVGFESYNQIWRFSAELKQPEAHVTPPAMADWPNNGGAEAMVRLRSGRFIVLSETGYWPGQAGHAAILFAGDPTVSPRRGFKFRYQPPEGGRYDPSDMTELPDGRLLVLNRAVRLPHTFLAKLTVIDPRDIRPGALVKGREIATLAAPLIEDNFEGVAITREGTDTILWMCSDDNQSGLQRSLLLKFRIDPGALGARRYP